jgi:hypothetical protein
MQLSLLLLLHHRKRFLELRPQTSKHLKTHTNSLGMYGKINMCIHEFPYHDSITISTLPHFEIWQHNSVCFRY